MKGMEVREEGEEGGRASPCDALCQPAVQLVGIPGGRADTTWQRQLRTKPVRKGFAPGLSLLLIGVAAGGFTGADLHEICGCLLTFTLVRESNVLL